MADRFGDDWTGRDGTAGGTRFTPLPPGIGPGPKLVEVTGAAGDVRRVDPDEPDLDPEVAEAAVRLRSLGSFRVSRSRR